MEKNKVRYYDNCLGHFYVDEDNRIKIRFVIFDNGKNKAVDITTGELYESGINLFKTRFGYQIEQTDKDGSIKEEIESHLPHPNVFVLPLGFKHGVLATIAEKVYIKLYEKYINNVGLNTKELNLCAKTIAILANEQTSAQAKHTLVEKEKAEAKENVFQNWAKEVAGVWHKSGERTTDGEEEK